MKRNRLTVLCAVLLVFVLSMGVFLVGCKDKDDPKNNEKKDAFISASPVQSFVYDGQQHDIEATLNHTEAWLSYSPAKGYTEIGEYDIKVSAPETENYKAVSTTVKLKITAQPVPTMLDLWGDLLSEALDTFSLGGKDKLKVNLNADADLKLKGKTTKFAIDVMGNLDFSEAVNNASVFHAVVGAGDDRFGLYYQDNALYLVVRDQVFAINSSDLTYLFAMASQAPDINIDSKVLGIVKTIVPAVLFREDDITRSKEGVYDVTLSLNHVWSVINTEFGKGLIGSMISEENLAIFGEFFEENEVAFNFIIDLTQSGSAAASVSANGDGAKLNAFELSEGFFDEVGGKLSQDAIDSAVEINLANVTVKGNIDLINVNGEDYEHLAFKLVADIDALALVKEITSNPQGWADSDAFRNAKLYFSLYHEHTPGENGAVCTDAMCPTRVGGQDDTSILDIAFDPQNFGDTKVYLAANLSRIFSEASIGATLGEILSLANMLASLKQIKDQNFMTSIDLAALIGGFAGDPSEPGDPDQDDSFKFDVNTMLDPLVSIITKAVGIGEEGVTLDMIQVYDSLNKVFDLDSLVNLSFDALGSTYVINTTSFANAIFKGILTPDGKAGTKEAFRSLRVGVKSFEVGNASDFNCKEAILSLPTDSAVKRTFGQSKPLAIGDANPTSTGQVFRTNGKLDPIYTAENGIHVSCQEELDNLVGKHIEYTYKALDGQTYTAKTQIVALKGEADFTQSGEQNVEVYVLPLDGKGGLLSDTLWVILDGVYGLLSGVLPNDIALPIRADVATLVINVTEIDSYELTVDKDLPETIDVTPFGYDPNAKFDLSEYMNGSIKLIYKDGYEHTQSITATCDTLLEGKYLVNDGSGVQHSIEFSYPGLGVVKTSKVSASTPTKPSIIVKDNGGISVLTYGATDADIKLNVKMVNHKAGLLGTTKKELKLEDFKVTLNGKTLDEINLSGDAAQLIVLAESGEKLNVGFKQKLTTSGLSEINEGHLYFYLTYGDGSTSEEIEYTKTFSKHKVGANWDSNVKYIDNLGENLDGAFVFAYYEDTDGEYAPERLVTLRFENGKYYMVNEEAGIKSEVAFDGLDLVDGLLSEEAYLNLHYNAAKKELKSSVTVSLKPKFEINGKEYTATATSMYLLKKIGVEHAGTAAVKEIKAEKTFDDLVKFTVIDDFGDTHTMLLVYKNGGYVFSDTMYEGANPKIDDIAVTAVANIYVSSSAVGDAVELVDGAVPSSYVGQKLKVVFEFNYKGLDVAYAGAFNGKTVVA